MPYTASAHSSPGLSAMTARPPGAIPAEASDCAIVRALRSRAAKLRNSSVSRVAKNRMPRSSPNSAAVRWRASGAVVSMVSMSFACLVGEIRDYERKPTE